MHETIYKLTLEETLYTLEQLKDSASKASSQIALAGRSNVGKSSLINGLAGRKQLAKVSSTPGKTASINFYKVDPGGFYLVDLPGYGYAQRSKSEREKWASLINAYLAQTAELKALAVLLDCRHAPLDLDRELITYAQSLALPIIPVLTKADKCSQKERSQRQREWSHFLGGQLPFLTAAGGPAGSKTGILELWKEFCRLAGATGQDEGASPDFKV